MFWLTLNIAGDDPLLIAIDDLHAADRPSLRFAGYLARRLADGPTLGIQQTKTLITRELDMPIGAAMELDAMTQALLMTTQDHAEFHAAFNAKRPPEWTGR